MATEVNIFTDLEYGINKVGYFLQDILHKESLSFSAENQRKECLEYLFQMLNTLHMLKHYPTCEDSSLINSGLSQSSQNLNDNDDEFGVMDIPRSGSLPNIPSSGGEGSSRSDSAKGKESDSDFKLTDMRELVIYDPIEEEEEEDEDEDDETDPLKLSSGSRSSIKRSRKRDSAVLFDISLGDLEDFDLAGFLTEKHSLKQWYCVLMDQHLCLFPSQDPSELAYDVVILPYCQISLDDRLMRTPVFRLTQPGMTPWVLVAKNNEELKEWINALTTAASGGKYNMTNSAGASSERRSSKTSCGQSMQAITEEDITEEAEEEEEEQDNSKLNSLSIAKPSLTLSSEDKKKEPEQLDIKKIEEHSVQETEKLPAFPTSPDTEETFGEDMYESIENYEFDDDGFATDEFESGSSDNEDTPSASPKGSPKLQQKTKKKNQIFKWLKKKARGKERLFSSPQDGIALAGYVHRIENNAFVKRWCVVREGKIYCYKNIKDEETELTLELDGAEIRAKEEEKNKFVIRVMRDNERLLTLLTKNTRDMDKWKTALRIESGFIKLASPADTSSGVFEDDEGDYVTPITPVGLQKISRAPAKSTTDSDTIAKPLANGNDEENGYLEVVFEKNQTNDAQKVDTPRPLSPMGKKSPEQESLGPLPSLPVDDAQKVNSARPLSPGKKSPEQESLGPLPPLPVNDAQKVNSARPLSPGKKSPEQESLGPLPPLPVDAQPPALPPPRRSPVPQVETQDKKDESEGSEQSEDLYEELINPLPNADKLSNWHKKEPDEKEVEAEEEIDVVSPDVIHIPPDGQALISPKPPLLRKVSFDDKVEVINKHLPPSMLPEAESDSGNNNNNNENNKQNTEKPQASQANEQEKPAPSPAKPNEKEIRSLPRRALKDSWIKERGSSDEKPRRKILSNGISNEQDKEREIIQKTEEEFLEMAKALKEQGSAAVRKKRPSFVAMNRMAFENKRREETVDDSKFVTRSQALNKEKADLLARIDFQKRRVAVAKDRKIFFTFSNTNNNTAMADAEMEFHESQLGLAKAKKRIAEIDSELKNIGLLEMKHQKSEDVAKKPPVKKRELKVLNVDGEEVKATVEQSKVEDERAQLLRGNVLSQIKVFEKMGEKQ